jgi:hypothetical protein
VDPFGLCWEWSQSAGSLTHVDDASGARELVYTGGYSGHGEGINNPDMENVRHVGPLPRGSSRIGPQQDNGRLRASMRLTPAPSNNMHGRSGFLIHGDNGRGYRSASEGCPVVPRWVRDEISGSGDDCFNVVE